MSFRVGQGFDVHRFDRNRPLMLGCVHVEGSAGLAGHSDADVVAHAIADALLGASSLGDLGLIFPPTAEWRDATGAEMLAAAVRRVREAGWELANVDATVIAEEPRLGPYREPMREAIAGALGLDVDAVSIKATTTDGLGFTGRGEGIACHAVVLVTR